MSLNTVSGRDPINGQLMVDPTSQQSSLPIDAIRIIFQNLKEDFHKLALVCKEWRNLADDKVLRETIRPVQAFGTQEWKKYIGVDAGEEPLLPRRTYGVMDIGNSYLTFIPEKVKMIQVNGKVDDASMGIEVVKEVPLDSLEVIGKLVSNPTKGNKIGYDPTSWQEFIEAKVNLEKSHWVLISKEVIGRNRTYVQQQELVARTRARISDIIDTVTSVFMEYVRSGERNFVCDPSGIYQSTYVRVNARTREHRVGLGFTPSGLLVYGIRHDLNHDFIAVAPQKSFGYFV